MSNTVFIHGPMGCGKTRNAEALKRHFECASIIDDWQLGYPITKGALHLTSADGIELHDDLDSFPHIVKIVEFKTNLWRATVPGFMWETQDTSAPHRENVAPEIGYKPAGCAHEIPVTLSAPGYEALAGILNRAFDQASQGKGKERHANGDPWHLQPIITIARMTGAGGPGFQVMKKTREALDMARRGEKDAAVTDLLGAIVYAAATLHLIETE